MRYDNLKKNPRRRDLTKRYNNMSYRVLKQGLAALGITK